jgi:N-acetylmuramoyl-L-alanine amidase
MKKLTILLIPGHGGDDPGAVNPRLSNADTEEEDINLNVAIALRDRLRAMGHEVLMSRDRDFFVSPADQAAMIRKLEPDCSIAIHANASTNPNVAGIEVFYRDAFDIELAGAVHDVLVTYTGMHDRGVHQDKAFLKRSLAVLGDLKTASILVELGFLSNDEEFRYLVENPLTLAEAIAEGIAMWAA